MIYKYQLIIYSHYFFKHLLPSINMKLRKGVFIIVYRKEKDKLSYLILKRKLHWKGWEFPKGGIEKGETINQGIFRELKEETGQKPIKITNHKIKGKYSYKQSLPNRIEKGQTFSLYSVELKNKKIEIDKHEHSDYQWLLFNKTIKKLTWPNQRRCLRIVDKKISI